MRIKDFLIGIIIILLVGIPTIFAIYGDWFWFLSIGYEQVFLTVLLTSIGLGLAFGLGFLVFSLINLKIVSRRSKKKIRMLPFTLLALVFSLILGLGFAGWETYLKFNNATLFGVIDPVFNLDISFYVFTLPWYNMLIGYAFTTILLTTIFTLAYYLVSSSVKVETEDEMTVYRVQWIDFKKKITPHLSVLVALIFFVLSAAFYFAQYGILFSSGGTIFGAGFTDINIMLPLMLIMAVISGILGLLLLGNVAIKRWKFIIECIGVLIVIGMIGIVAAGITQGFYVQPDELTIEKPFIERNIEYTLKAYNLEEVEERPFIVEDLTVEDIKNNRETLDNIRLWDFRPLKSTYEQLQLFRTYYNFNDIDIDRYVVDGKPRQVMISAREMNTMDLPSNARTWVNEHIVYTHGYGIVMNPVNRVTPEGLPEFFVKNIPPEDNINLNIERPEIYFGERTNDYVIVKTNTQELDYPSGKENVYTEYEGESGILLDTFKRLVYAIKFGSIELFFSGSITPDSKLLMNRNIVDRIDTIAPFLFYDSDPYIVAVDGKLYWILDGYSITDQYPYSEPVFRGINYIRNSVKVVVDAYTGDVTYYVIDKDPVVSTYMKIFPDIFKDFSEMPDSLKDHIRYPEDMFAIQKEIYSTFHMKDSRVFYNKEDVWVTPYEILRGSKQEMIPYYIIMKLPGEAKEEFIMMIPFTPKGKDNLIGWMAAKSDPEEYGKLIVFTFSKQELLFGPLQIEARIDQDTEISQRITLWSQAGSDVFRGNILVIPIENSILYVEPLFLEATEQGTLPELKRVIVAHGNKISMQPTLEEALTVIFGAPVVEPEPGEITEPQTDKEKLEQLRVLYQKAEQALRSGDLSLYANYIKQIGALLS